MQFFPNLLANAGGDLFTRTTLPVDESVGRHLSLVVAATPANAEPPASIRAQEHDTLLVALLAFPRS